MVFSVSIMKTLLLLLNIPYFEVKLEASIVFLKEQLSNGNLGKSYNYQTIWTPTLQFDGQKMYPFIRLANSFIVNKFRKKL